MSVYEEMAATHVCGSGVITLGQHVENPGRHGEAAEKYREDAHATPANKCQWVLLALTWVHS
jgi:hypothetical protein